MSSPELILKARTFADSAFKEAGHQRKYTGEDYITHCDDIIEILKENNIADVASLEVAVHLHDVIEDTPLTEEDLRREFPDVDVDIAIELTDIDPKTSNLSRRERKKLDAERLKNASTEAKTIKIADIASNFKSIKKYDPVFALTFVSEALGILGGFSEMEYEGRLETQLFLMRTYNELNEALVLLKEESDEKFYYRTEIALPYRDSFSTNHLFQIGHAVFKYKEALCDYARTIKGIPDKLRAINVRGNIFDKHNRPEWDEPESVSSDLTYGRELLAKRLFINVTRSLVSLDKQHHLEDISLFVDKLYGEPLRLHVDYHNATCVDKANASFSCSVPVLDTPVWETDITPHWSFIYEKYGTNYNDFTYGVMLLSEIIENLPSDTPSGNHTS